MIWSNDNNSDFAKALHVRLRQINTAYLESFLHGICHSLRVLFNTFHYATLFMVWKERFIKIYITIKLRWWCWMWWWWWWFSFQAMRILQYVWLDKELVYVLFRLWRIYNVWFDSNQVDFLFRLCNFSNVWLNSNLIIFLFRLWGSLAPRPRACPRQ